MTRIGGKGSALRGLAYAVLGLGLVLYLGPFLIQLALLHLRRGEQHPLLETDIETGCALSGPPMRPILAGSTILPEQIAPERDAC